MLRRGALLVARLGVLAALGGFSACTCGYTAGIINETDSPVFANISYDWEGQREEEEGVLIPPHDQAELDWVFDAYLRIRDLSGNTIAFRYLPKGDDVDVVVSSLEPVPNPEPLGIPPWSGEEGLSTTWRRIICRNRHEEEVPQFWMTVTVHSDFDGPLIASGLDPLFDRKRPGDQKEIRGVLVSPRGEARLFLDIVEQGWIVAYDPRARLVFTRAVPREPLPVVTIPASLPPEPEPLPAFDTSCEHRSSPTSNLVGDALGAGVIFFVAALAGATWWGIRRKMRAG